MDWLQFWSSVIGALAWPVAAVVIAFMFREEVKKLLDKMKSLKAPGGIEASFSEEVKKIAEEAKQLSERKAPHVVPRSLAEQDAVMRLLIEERPTAVILDAWRNIEKAVLDVVTDRGYAIDPSDLNDVGVWISTISKDVPREITDLIHELRALRNKVAHNMFEPDQQAAFNYLLGAQRVIDALKATVHFQGSIDGGTY